MTSVVNGPFLGRGNFAGPFYSQGKYTTPYLFLNFKNAYYRNPAGYNRTNYIPNSTMVGATASSLPTGWSFQAATGLTQSVVGTGTEFGRNYIDWSVVGTTATTTFPTIFTSPGGLSAVTNAPAANGQTWTSSNYYRLVSGTLPANTFGSGFVAYNSAGVSVGSPLANVLMTSGGFARNSGTATIALATTAGVQSFVGAGAGLPAGTYSFVLRIYQPQLEQAGSPSSDILTTSAPVTVKTYISNNPADVGNLTYTRAGTAYASDASGNLIAFADNVPRITNTGYWAEPSSTNSIPNSTANNGAVAGTPGTLPTGWVVDYNPSALSTQVVGTGTEGGVPYVDFRAFGTFLANSQINLSFTAATTIVAAQGQTWTGTNYVRAVAGSATNLTFVSQSIADETAVGSYLGSSQSNYAVTTLFTPTSVTQTRMSHTRTLASATTARVLPTFVLSSTPGGAVDITLRIAAPQLEQSATATSYIPTTSGSVTRPADVGYYTLSSSLSGAYSLAAVGQSNSATGATPIVAQLDDGSDATRATIFLGVGGSTSTANGISFVAGANQFTLTSANTATNSTNIGVALAVQTSRAALSANGGAVVAASGGTIPTVSILRLGSFFSGANPLNGTLKSAAIYSSALPDAEVIYRSQGNLS